MEKRWCSACGNAFEPRPQSPRQAYCSTPQCQKVRKLLWQLAKRRADADYHQDQAEFQKAWRSKNQGYWKRYREAHPDYANENRLQQRRRNRGRAPDPGLIAKSDASSSWPPPSGLFKLIEVSSDVRTVPRVWTVFLSPVVMTPT